MPDSPAPDDDALPDVDIDAYERSLLGRQGRWAAASVIAGGVCVLVGLLALAGAPRLGILVLGGVGAIGSGVSRWRAAGARLAELTSDARRPS